MIGEFKDFLKEYKVLPLAIAFIMGAAITAVVTSLVNDMIMPIVEPLMPSGGWQSAKLTIGSVELGVGSFLAALVNFIIIAWVVFVMAKMILKEEKVTKK
ncbi:MAG: MscL family protein [Kosmotogaceae bacterium]|nr:MscL family protein [Kosmotogaceae bacterium]